MRDIGQSSAAAGRFILAIGLSLIFSAGALGWVEAQTYLNRGTDPKDTIARFLAGEIVPGMSEPSLQQFGYDCLEVFASLYYRTRPDAERRAFASVCQSHLRGRMTANPAFSFAWYVLAVADSIVKDITSLNRNLVLSQVTGSNEQWIAEQRVQLSESRFADLSYEAAAAEERDLRMLVVSQRGISSIARRYVEDATFRERITAIVEQLPLESQRRFIDYVQQAAASSK